MNIILYLVIFLSKVIENSLATLRLIVVANGKKWLGAILQFMVALVWIFVTSLVVHNIIKDILKIVAFALGSLVGSYVGSIIEQKMALGESMVFSIVNNENKDKTIETLQNHNFALTYLKGEGSKSPKTIIVTMIPRKQRKEVIDIIKNCDPKSMIISEKAVSMYGGTQKETGKYF